MLALAFKRLGTAVALWSAVSGAACSPNHDTGTPNPQQQSMTSSGDSTASTPRDRGVIPEGLYFGISETSDGVRAWLLRSDVPGETVRLYAPPDNPVLVASGGPPGAGDIVMRSPTGFANNYYVLRARVLADAVDGTVETMRAQRRGDSLITRATVHLRRVRGDQAQAISGLYSNVEMNSESGDATGEELILLDAPAGHRTAVLTAFGGDLVPYAATEVQVAGERLRLKFRTAAGDEVYRVEPSARGVVMQAIAGEENAAETLARKVGPDQLLRTPKQP